MNTLSFSVTPEWHGIAPPPIPAAEHVPDWFKQIKNETPAPSLEHTPQATIKRCMPFLDALVSGYLVLTPSRIYVTANDEGVHFRWDVKASHPLVTTHPLSQYEGSGWGQAFKWINPWHVRAPEGWSLLFTNPLNRDLPFKAIDGIVDCDSYTAPVNFPFLWTKFPFEGWIEKGTPIVQLIPIKREQWTHSVQRMDDDSIEAKRQLEMNADTEIGHYRSNYWERKDFR